MVFLHINPKNYNDISNTKTKMSPIMELNKMISTGKQIFMLIYKEGCPPCIETRPEWAKLYSNPEIIAKQDIVVVDIDKELTEHIHNLKKEPLGYPTMRYITDGGNTYEDYEDSQITTKDRSIDSFVAWINSKTATKKKIPTMRRKTAKKPRNTKRARNSKKSKKANKSSKAKKSRR
jgi:hypothetical protein